MTDRHGAWPPAALTDCAAEIVACPDAARKAALAQSAADAWRAGRIAKARGTGRPFMPERPGRPARPRLRPPREVPKRPLGSAAGRVALLHALAHIELNAVDLAWDVIGRFGPEIGERAFFDDWAQVGGEEGLHFSMLEERLRELGSHYGALDAHDGLWQAAAATSRNALARLAVVPLVLEARGLDVSPGLIARLRSVGDDRSAKILERIYHDEIGHVAAGMRWFVHLAQARGLDPCGTYHECVRRFFSGKLKPPFNQAARVRAGLMPQFYEPLSR